MIEGVAGVIIWTDRLVQMSDFYRNDLGLEPHSVRPDFVAFRWGDMRLSIGAHDHVTGKREGPVPHHDQPQRWGHTFIL